MLSTFLQLLSLNHSNEQTQVCRTQSAQSEPPVQLGTPSSLPLLSSLSSCCCWMITGLSLSLVFPLSRTSGLLCFHSWHTCPACQHRVWTMQSYARLCSCSPDVNHGEWTPSEEMQLVKLHAQLGSAWSRISQLLPGRPANACKNKFNGTMVRCPRGDKG